MLVHVYKTFLFSLQASLDISGVTCGVQIHQTRVLKLSLGEQTHSAPLAGKGRVNTWPSPTWHGLISKTAKTSTNVLA